MMEVQVETPILSEIKESLLLSYLQSTLRGLLYSANWYDMRRQLIVQCHHMMPCLSIIMTIGLLNWPTASE